MNARTLWHLHGARLRLHPRAPGRGDGCPAGCHPYPQRAIDRHAHGVHHCPLCYAEVKPVRLPDGQVRIPAHRRLSSVTVRAVGR